MLRYKNLLITVAFTLLLAAAGYSQTRSVSELESAITGFESAGLFSAGYDDSKDATTIHLSFDVRSDDPKLQKEFKEFIIDLTSIYTGIGIDSKPYRTLLCANSRGKKFHFASNRQLRVSLDGQEFTLAEGQRTTEVRGGKVTENLCWDVDQELIRDFGSAGKMTLTIGTIPIILREEKIRAFRDYSSLLIYDESE
ncbi:MAG: hypothetical protein R2681_08315 [Pyrinomonadaceae bacterium]